VACDFAFWLGGSPPLDYCCMECGCLSVRGSSAPRPFPSKSGVRTVVEGPEARTNVCDLHACNSLVPPTGDGNVPGAFPFCKTHGMASACAAWRRDLSGRQARLLLHADCIGRSIDQAINRSNKSLVAILFFAQDRTGRHRVEYML
jgi:hypothetical protein